MARWAMWLPAGFLVLALPVYGQAPPPGVAMPPGVAPPPGVGMPPGPPPTAFSANPAAVPPPGFCPDPLVSRPMIPFEQTKIITNAFDSPERCEHNPCPYYFWTLGAMGMIREGLGNGVLVVRDIQATDTGIAPPRTAPVAYNYSDLQPPYNWGVRGSFGVSDGPLALELAGYYLFDRSMQRTVIPTLNIPVALPIALTGTLSLPFGAFPSPAGFEGNNNMWLQASQVRVSLGYEVGNVEMNVRCRSDPFVECMIGVRYFDLAERFGILTVDDGRVAQPTSPLTIADYTVQVQNRVLAPQIGFELYQPVVPTLLLSAFGKAAFGVNFVDVEQALTRGDGFRGPSGRRTLASFSYIFDFGVYAEFCFNEHLRLRGGYQGLLVAHVPEAHQQVNFNPNIPLTTVDDRGSIFFHGPMVEFVFAF